MPLIFIGLKACIALFNDPFFPPKKKKGNLSLASLLDKFPPFSCDWGSNPRSLVSTEEILLTKPTSTHKFNDPISLASTKPTKI